MPSYIDAFDAICQSCDRRFKIKETYSRVVNLDTEGFEKERFVNETLNKVSCPFCKSRFTFEIPMIVFSMSMKFAYLVEPNLTCQNLITIKAPPHIILPHDFEFRVVRYLAEAKEKYDIHISGLNDASVEYIKLTSFDDSMAMPFDERNIIFMSHADGVYTFKQVDYNDNILNTYSIEFSDDKIPECIFNITKSHNGWLKIDRESLKEEIQCQNTKISL